MNDYEFANQESARRPRKWAICPVCRAITHVEHVLVDAVKGDVVAMYYEPTPVKLAEFPGIHVEMHLCRGRRRRPRNLATTVAAMRN